MRLKYIFTLLICSYYCIINAQSPVDSTLIIHQEESVVVRKNSSQKSNYPSPQKAAIYSAIFPGAGQIYNHKYWKLPIIYGGIGACIYALTWNNRLYNDYFNAYRDFTVTDENGNHIGDSYLPFVPGGDVDNLDNDFFESSLRLKKDYYKKYRDLSAIILAGIYVLNILDANVDAQFYDFDISRNLSLKIDPIILNNPVNSEGDMIGLKMSIKF